MWKPYFIVVLSGLFFLGELIASHLAQSLILLMDSYHMLYNLLSVILLVVSCTLSETKTEKNTYGWVRLQVLGILVNLLLLAALCFAVVVEGIQGLVHPEHQEEHIHYPFLVLAFGIARLLVNISAWILIGGYTQHQSPLMKIQNLKDEALKTNAIMAKSENTTNGWNSQKMMDILRDNSGCLLVICCGCLVYFLNKYVPAYVDFIFSLLAILILFLTSYQYVQESSLILLQTMPRHINMDILKTRLAKEFPSILNVHDIHIWRLTNAQTIATIHVVFASVPIYTAIANQLAIFFKNEGISKLTIQPEFCESDNQLKKSDCILNCSPNNNCQAFTCCGHLLVAASVPKEDRAANPTPQAALHLAGDAKDQQPVDNQKTLEVV